MQWYAVIAEEETVNMEQYQGVKNFTFIFHFASSKH